MCHGEVFTGDMVNAREMMLGTRDTFHYLSCDLCGSLTLADPPEDWIKYYPQSLYYSMSESPVLYSASWRRRLKTDVFLRVPGAVAKLADHLPTRWRLSAPLWFEWFRSNRMNRSSHVLDVGSGTGALLHKLAADGFRSLVGVDPYIENSLDYSDGVRIVKGEVGDLVGSGTFDMIMFHHSLEHMDDPVSQLTARGGFSRRAAPFSFGSRSRILGPIGTMDRTGFNWIRPAIRSY